eukprot:SAG11_NODE_5514_length_1539_cov_1.110417_3_plen_106_part_00
MVAFIHQYAAAALDPHTVGTVSPRPFTTHGVAIVPGAEEWLACIHNDRRSHSLVVGCERACRSKNNTAGLFFGLQNNCIHCTLSPSSRVTRSKTRMAQAQHRSRP